MNLLLNYGFARENNVYLKQRCIDKVSIKVDIHDGPLRSKKMEFLRQGYVYSIYISAKLTI